MIYVCRNNKKLYQGGTKGKDFRTIGRVTFLKSHTEWHWVTGAFWTSLFSWSNYWHASYTHTHSHPVTSPGTHCQAPRYNMALLALPCGNGTPATVTHPWPGNLEPAESTRLLQVNLLLCKVGQILNSAISTTLCNTPHEKKARGAEENGENHLCLIVRKMDFSLCWVINYEWDAGSLFYFSGPFAYL